MIDRRTVLLASLATTGFARLARAQRSRPLLAVLSPASHDRSTINPPFHKALASLGWEAGRNIEIIERFANRDESRLPGLAAELVSHNPAVLFTNTSYAAMVAARATDKVPIVVGTAGEATLIELAGGTLARPTTNVTGFVATSSALDDKAIELFTEAAPAPRRIGLLINPRNPVQTRYPGILKITQSLSGKTLIRLEASGIADIDAALHRATDEKIEALFVPDDPHIAADPAVRERTLRFATAARVPIGSSHLPYAHAGALVTMGPSLPALAAASAGYVDKILKGAKPSELPVQRPSIFTVIVNQKAASILGLMLPTAILLRADEVIE